jgi:hypothetical protein
MKIMRLVFQERQTYIIEPSLAWSPISVMDGGKDCQPWCKDC